MFKGLFLQIFVLFYLKRFLLPESDDLSREATPLAAKSEGNEGSYFWMFSVFASGNCAKLVYHLKQKMVNL